MSLKLGTTTIAGLSKETTYISNAHQLLDFKWSDHLLNDISWLRADTFSWQSGTTYSEAYNHLVSDISGITSETETIGSYTVTFYRATDGHKICLADQETTIANIYSETGIAWYYILDTVNTQFKLPRTKYGFEGLRTNVGDNIDESLPNITGIVGSISTHRSSNPINDYKGAFRATATDTYSSTNNGNYRATDVNFDASRSSSTYQDNAPVQERATQMYLYFYVGDYSQSAIEQTAGLNAELFNGKADTDLSNLSATGQKVIDGQWVYKGQNLASKVTMSSSNHTYSLSSYLPADSYKYEVLIGGVVTTGTTSGNAIELRVGTDIVELSYVCSARTRTNSSMFAIGNITTSVGTGRSVVVQGGATWTGSFGLYIYGYRRIGTNS